MCEDHENECSAPELKSLHTPTAFPNIVFICFETVIFVHMWGILSYINHKTKENFVHGFAFSFHNLMKRYINEIYIPQITKLNLFQRFDRVFCAKQFPRPATLIWLKPPLLFPLSESDRQALIGGYLYMIFTSDQPGKLMLVFYVTSSIEELHLLQNRY